MVRAIFRWLLGLAMISAGLNHFLTTPVYLGMMPAYLPWPLALVYINGVAEVAGGVGVLMPALRRAAGWGLIVLLVAVFPANLDAALHGMRINDLVVPQWVLWVRLPFQALFIAWVWWACELGKREK